MLQPKLIHYKCVPSCECQKYLGDKGEDCQYCGHPVSLHEVRIKVFQPKTETIEIYNEHNTLIPSLFDKNHADYVLFDVFLRGSDFDVFVCNVNSEEVVVVRIGTSLEGVKIEVLENKGSSGTKRYVSGKYCNHPRCLKGARSGSPFCSNICETDSLSLRGDSWWDSIFTNTKKVKIMFYEKNEAYYEFTNFYEPAKPIQIDGKEWKTSEHYFQAQKFTKCPSLKDIFERSPENLEILNRCCKNWNQLSIKLAETAIRAKMQDPSLLSLLKDLDGTHIECHSKSIWSHCNVVLAQILTELRKQHHPDFPNRYDSVQIEGKFNILLNESLGKPFEVNRKKYSSVVDYIIENIFTDEDTLLEVVRKLPTPRDTFEFVRQAWVRPFIRKDWEDVKLSVMRQAVYEKFNQDVKLRKILKDTKDHWIIEHTTNDTIWADGGDCGSGESGANLLGKILMFVREDI